MGKYRVSLSFIAILLVLVSFLAPVFALNSPSEHNFTSEHVTKYDLKSFNRDLDDIPKSGMSFFIMFYSTGCIHCHRAFPEFANLGNALKEDSDVIKLGVVDIDKNPQVMQRVTITHYPTFFLFSQGLGDGKGYEAYKNERTVGGFMNFLKGRVKVSRDATGKKIPPYAFMDDHKSIAKSIMGAKSSSEFDTIISKLESNVKSTLEGTTPGFESYTLLLKLANKLKNAKDQPVHTKLKEILKKVKDVASITKNKNVEVSLTSWKNREQLIFILEELLKFDNSSDDEVLNTPKDLISDDI